MVVRNNRDPASMAVHAMAVLFRAAPAIPSSARDPPGLQWGHWFVALRQEPPTVPPQYHVFDPRREVAFLRGYGPLLLAYPRAGVVEPHEVFCLVVEGVVPSPVPETPS